MRIDGKKLVDALCSYQLLQSNGCKRDHDIAKIKLVTYIGSFGQLQ